ncbi:haloacid dehalogenase-like hydrolase [Aliiroseovarius sediminilitoris]|uniref:Haloacid dehalogenase-like hydrolase n=1 Tax=Aliiroseovarius sediminilitoris TaxID=1173584 RepID=A0A1I0N286_9RHOB|nr:HAD family hydrolase [Aliiroseovarius sediminilitoris]SEV94468.1 haloacid dehalogenase-like hydrolase [Aliiroseovarius sediminilitoris]
MTHTDRTLAVDVCGTLYDTNTTAGLVTFHHARRGHRWRFAMMKALTRRRSMLQQGLILFAKLSRFDAHRALVLASLRGETLTSLQASATRYVADHLPTHAIPAAHARVAQMRASGWQPVLVSNALAPVIEEIARKLELPCIASQPDVQDGCLTGRLFRDLTGQKRKAIEAYLNHSLDHVQFAVITDNRSDRDLVAVAYPAVLVASRTPRKWMRKWDAEILCH